MEDEFIELDFCVLSSGIVINEIESSGLEFCSYFFKKTRQEHMKDIKVRESGKSPIQFCYTSYICWETLLSGWMFWSLPTPPMPEVVGSFVILMAIGFGSFLVQLRLLSSFWQNFVLYEMAYLWQNFLGLKSSLSMWMQGYDITCF